MSGLAEVCFKQMFECFTGKSMSEALGFQSTNPQYDNRLSIELQVWMKIPKHVVYRNCFGHSDQFLYTTCSPHVLSL